MGNTFGKLFRITTWGESHGKAVGVVIDNCPAGLALSEEDIQIELNRRRPGQSKVTTSRLEKDEVLILSGVFQGKTLGTPISLIVKNQDTDPSKYEKLKNLYRPGHADFTYEAKYGIRDWRGGGRASGRETLARVAAGAVARKILAQEEIEIIGYTVQIGDIRIMNHESGIMKQEIDQSIVRCPDSEASQKMIELIEKVKAKGDSIGGVVEVRACNVPAGLGEPVFDKLSADISKALMSIPGVKGVEIGDGFKVAEMKGSENNDEFISDKDQIKMKTNHCGGVLGGISTGGDIVARIAVKPTSSIAQEQTTVDKSGHTQKIKIRGRHDPCLCPRIVPVAEAMMGLVLVDHWLRQ